MTELRFNRYQFHCQTQAPLHLNTYSGSTLRGVFGRALRKVVCMRQTENCDDCMLARQCIYTKVFTTKTHRHTTLQTLNGVPSAFVIEPPPLGSTYFANHAPFRFSMILIGQAIDYLPVIIHVWEIGLQQGLGKNHTPLTLQKVIFEPGQAVEHTLYTQGAKQVTEPPAYTKQKVQPAQRIALQLTTPLRIQKKGRILIQNITARDFLMALIRRYYLLQELNDSENYRPPDFAKLSQQAEHIHCSASLKYFAWQRYSIMQQQRMTFSGALGKITLQGDLTPFQDIIHRGQWLHVGNKTSFGMGGYQIINSQSEE